jgi:hypothetical protein
MQIMYLGHEYITPCLIFCYRSSALSSLVLLIIGIAQDAVTVMPINAQDSQVQLNFNYMAANTATLTKIGEPCLIVWQEYSVSP